MLKTFTIEYLKSLGHDIERVREVASCTESEATVETTDPRWRQLCKDAIEKFRTAVAEAAPAQPKQKSRGLGDTIARLTKAVGIKPCGGCKSRQAALNKLVPYRPS
jgi:hypothetical protein